MQVIVVTNMTPDPAPPIEPTPTIILPYYGVGPITTNYTPELILGLAFRGDAPSRFYSFSLDALNTQYMYYAYPTEYGLATFYDRDNNMEGGWDGALAHLGTLGPATVNVYIEGNGNVPFYLYRSEWPWSGTSRWRVQ